MNVAADRNRSLTLIGPDLACMMSLSIALNRLYEPTLIQSPQPMNDAKRAAASRPDCMIVRITQQDSIVDVRNLLAAAPATTQILFLAHTLPLRAPIARAIRDAGHAVVDKRESVVTIGSTLIAMRAPEGARA